MDPHSYLVEIKARWVASSAVASFTIVEERASSDRGYLRARLTLSNNDFLEVVEYFPRGRTWRDKTVPLSVDGRVPAEVEEALG